MCASAAVGLTAVEAIATHARVTAHKNKLQDESLESTAPTMTVKVKTPTPRALANAEPRLPHFRIVFVCGHNDGLAPNRFASVANGLGKSGSGFGATFRHRLLELGTREAFRIRLF